MIDMIVAICLVWSDVDQKCMSHKSQVKYINMRECRKDIQKSEQLVIAKIMSEFDRKPINHLVKASCFNGV
tara:strand:+ start:546 stop:758 length:213 start_codon:yes stop_codon:yes gene_type:complete